jgi:hypothetical protein
MLNGQRAIRNAHGVKSSYLVDEKDADRSQAAQQDIEHVSMLRVVGKPASLAGPREWQTSVPEKPAYLSSQRAYQSSETVSVASL